MNIIARYIKKLHQFPHKKTYLTQQWGLTIFPVIFLSHLPDLHHFKRTENIDFKNILKAVFSYKLNKIYYSKTVHKTEDCNNESTLVLSL